MSGTAAVPVDISRSFARREDGSVRCVLWVSDAELEATRSARLSKETVRMRLSHAKRRRVRDAEVVPGETGLRLEFSVPAHRLAGGVWRLACLTPGRGGPIPLEVRLLAVPQRPVALLPGPEPQTRLPHPTTARPSAWCGGWSARIGDRARRALRGLARHGRGRAW